MQTGNIEDPKDVARDFLRYREQHRQQQPEPSAPQRDRIERIPSRRQQQTEQQD
jgi:hypothetical protein